MTLVNRERKIRDNEWDSIWQCYINRIISANYWLDISIYKIVFMPISQNYFSNFLLKFTALYFLHLRLIFFFFLRFIYLFIYLFSITG